MSVFPNKHKLCSDMKIHTFKFLYHPPNINIPHDPVIVICFRGST